MGEICGLYGPYEVTSFNADARLASSRSSALIAINVTMKKISMVRTSMIFKTRQVHEDDFFGSRRIILASRNSRPIAKKFREAKVSMSVLEAFWFGFRRCLHGQSLRTHRCYCSDEHIK